MPGARTHDVITVVTGLALAPIGYSWVLHQSPAHSIADWLVTDGKHLLHGVGIHVARDYSEHDNWERHHAAHHHMERRW